MLLSETITTMLNVQAAHEMKNEHIYRCMEAYYEGLNLHGFAALFRSQAEGEYEHRQKILDYMYKKNAKVQILPPDYAVEEYPDNAWITMMDDFYTTEIGTTEKINNILAACRDEGDYSTEHDLISWLIVEQNEEEAFAIDMQTQMQLITGASEQIAYSNLRLIDAELYNKYGNK